MDKKCLHGKRLKEKINAALEAISEWELNTFVSEVTNFEKKDSHFKPKTLDLEQEGVELMN
jgi:hypothetical protein